MVWQIVACYKFYGPLSTIASHRTVKSKHQNTSQEGAEEDEEMSDEDETRSSSASRPSSSKSNDSTETRTRKSYVPTPTLRSKKLKTDELLGEIKETVASLKTLSSENTSSQVLEFLKEESKRQSERDNALFNMMATFFQHPAASPHPVPSSPHPGSLPHHSQSQSSQYFAYPTQSFTQSYPNSNLHSQFPHHHRYGMTNMQPPASSEGSQERSQEESYTSQLMNPDYP